MIDPDRQIKRTANYAAAREALLAMIAERLAGDERFVTAWLVAAMDAATRIGSAILDWLASLKAYVQRVLFESGAARFAAGQDARQNEVAPIGSHLQCQFTSFA